MCLGCLFAGIVVSFPRVGLLILWIFTPWVERAIDAWYWAVLGLIFLPLTTLMYVLVRVSTVGDINTGGWLLIALGVVADVVHWGQMVSNRQNGVGLYNRYGPSAMRAD
jgi:hypothetical protein